MFPVNPGLDRTGIIAPVMNAYSLMAYSMVDQTTNDRANGKLPNACLPMLAEMAIRYSRDLARHAHVNTWQETHAHGSAPPPQLNCAALAAGANDIAFLANGGKRIISIFQSLVLETAIHTSIKISFASTGVFGLKWSTEGNIDQGLAKFLVKYFVPNSVAQALIDGDFKSAAGKRSS